MVDVIKNAIQRKELPTAKSDLLEPLLEDGRKFIPQEGIYWDFKREWPFSYSDGYFAGIARLICAFANTYGGIIIFGVHDSDRSPGHNKVAPNVDRLQQALGNLLSEPPQLLCRRYDEGKPGAVDVLLVCPNEHSIAPLRFVRDVGDYKANVIWVRQNHEVVTAEPRHIGMLYCRSVAQVDAADDLSLQGGLPPSPATIKRFVGRLNTIDRIFGWLKRSDEPRTFLYGKGGSGKTTIAYEVAKVLKFEGSHVPMNGGECLDNVVFISAKQQMLDVMDQSTRNFVGLDFSNERELYEAIITLSNWTTEPLNEFNIDQLKNEIRSLFDLTSNLVVIDDIDTLTTKGAEAGFDFLYSVLWRAKRRSKVLYTIRNAPTQSLANSIEVPGLEGRDYEEFVQVCANQFHVPMPDKDFVAKKLATLSERRPLVIENIMALRRTAGNYERAVHLFEEGSGEDVRSYVFQREWNSLPTNNYGRYFLAILAIHGEPLTFADIVALTRYDEGRVRDALADVREMFLQLNEVGTETTFQLGALTRAFVYEQSKKLDLYSALKERVEKYKRNFYPENPILSRLRDRVESLAVKGLRLADKEVLKQALQIVVDPTLSPKISEDPRFMALQAFVYACQSPPNIEDARRLFGHVFTMKCEPEIEYLKKWFYIERNSGHGLDQCVRIADFVCQGKRYSDDEKIEFLSRKGTCLYNRGRNDIFFSPETAFSDIRESLTCHLVCYAKNVEAGSMKTEKSEEYARNTAFYLFDYMVMHGIYDHFFDTILGLCGNANLRLDPIEDAFVRAMEMMVRERGAKQEIQKIRGRLDYLRKEVERKSQWFDKSARDRIVQAITSTSQALGQTAANSPNKINGKPSKGVSN
jgi:DNA polymerase III delta prime subunit